MTEQSLPGMNLKEALELLRQQGIVPSVVFSLPPRLLNDLEERGPRIVRYKDNQLLCSYFRDADPEAE